MNEKLLIDKRSQVILFVALAITLFGLMAAFILQNESVIGFLFGASFFFYISLGLVQIISLCATYKLKKAAAPRAFIFYIVLLFLLMVGALAAVS